MYAKFGGLGIHNCLLHARVVTLRAETKNVHEMLSYRTIATTEQALALMVGYVCLSLATEGLQSTYIRLCLCHSSDAVRT